MLFLMVIASRSFTPGECIPFSEAPKYVGTSKCVSGKVLKITRLESGTTFLNFCEDYRACPFQVVIFRSDLRHVGDVRQLEGRTIEVEGDIREYDRHPEVILRDNGQLRGGAAKIPPLPKGFDVENKGRFSAGKMKYPKSTNKRKKPSRQNVPADTGDAETQ
jgi:hypothetical protein